MTVAPSRTPSAPSVSASSVLIIGAGFGGIAAAIELQNHGFNDITILEAASGIGGTWFHNTYPGSACDIPSQLYSYSYAQRRDWSRLCSPQEEILAYIEGVAADHGVDQRIQLSSPVATCTWSGDDQRWTATTTDGRTFTAGAVIVATGQLNHPMTPNIPGLDQFEGHTFHSARWDHQYPLAGKRVAVIGNGASAAQFVPEIAPEVKSLAVFQRTPNWFMPRKNRPYPGLLRRLYERVPPIQTYRRGFVFQYTENITRSIRHPRTVGWYLKAQSIVFMRWQLRGDPELRRKVWPDYTFGCKRILFSSKFLPALRRPNVELVTDPITEITPDGVKTESGRLHPVDCLIYGTGFRTNEFMLPMQITGAAGRPLQEVWEGGAHAHLGMTVPGFPSMFLMYGPNTNTSGGSILIYLEAQAAYIRQALEVVRASGSAAIDVRPEVEAASDRELQARFAGTAWLACNSWYRAAGGRIVANWPGYMREYLDRTRALDQSEFTLLPVAAPASTAAKK